MSQIAQIINDLIKNKFFQFALNEYHWDDKSGAPLELLLDSYTSLLNMPIFNILTTEFNIFKNSKGEYIFDKFKKFIKNGARNINTYKILNMTLETPLNKDIIIETFDKLYKPILENEEVDVPPVFVNDREGWASISSILE